MTDSFYITLPSNVKSFETNTVSKFKTKLASKINLSEKWQVGLSSIKYTKSWYNIKNTMYLKIYKRTSSRSIEDLKALINMEREIHDDQLFIIERVPILQSGHYENLDELLTILNENLNKKYKEREISIKFNKNNNTCELKWKNIGDAYFNFSGELREILGFNNHIDFIHFSESQCYKFSTRGIDLTGNLHSLFVYTDIIEPSYVGDCIAPLIQSISVAPVKFGEDIEVTYDNIHYHNVLLNEFETIEVNIRDETGAPFEFQFGITGITLF